MNGSGAVVTLNGTSYNIDSAKLSAATTNFVSHLGTIAGSGYKVVVGGNEYKISSAKMTDAIGEIETVLGGLNSPNAGGSDTLTWDGNTDGRLIVNDAFVKISDVVLTSDDLENGYKFSYVFDGVTDERELTEYECPNDDILVICDGGVICVSTDGVSIDEFVFPEKGIYIGIGYTEASPVSLTIHGYNGFETTTTVKVKLSILFDGTTSGKEGVQFEGMQPLYRISDAVCTWEELSSGHIQMKNGEDVFNAVIGEVGGVEILADNVFMPDALPIYVVLEDNAVLSEAYIFPKKGIYAPEYLLAESVTGSITIPV